MKTVPETKLKHKTVLFETLASGDAFVYGGDLYIVACKNQEAVCLLDGGYLEETCSTEVIPVNATVTWSYKDQKKKK